MASLIKVGSGKVPPRAVQFTDGNGERKTIWLGKVGLPAAREFKSKVEAVLSARIMNQPPDMPLSAWLAGLSDKMHAKLAVVGLVEPRTPPPTAPALSAWLDKYLRQRKGDLKPSSIVKLNVTAGRLREYFGQDTPIDAITPSAAKDWRVWLATQGLADATIRLQCRNVKTIFNEAAERELIRANPFRKLVSRAIAAKRDRYVTPDETTAILDACPDIRWRVLVGLARLAGLRVPSETHILTWADVDWNKNRLTVNSPKTERYEGKDKRSVPIVPKLLAILQDAFDAAEDGEEQVCRLSRNNLHRNLHAILKRAEIEPFERCYQVLRQSRETEWSERFPQHAVSAWLGHSEMVSRDHYLQVTDDMFNRATGRGAAESAAKGAAAPSRTDPQGVAKGADNSSVSRKENTTEIGVFASDDTKNRTGPGGI